MLELSERGGGRVEPSGEGDVVSVASVGGISEANSGMLMGAMCNKCCFCGSESEDKVEGRREVWSSSNAIGLVNTAEYRFEFSFEA